MALENETNVVTPDDSEQEYDYDDEASLRWAESGGAEEAYWDARCYDPIEDARERWLEEMNTPYTPEEMEHVKAQRALWQAALEAEKAANRDAGLDDEPPF